MTDPATPSPQPSTEGAVEQVMRVMYLEDGFDDASFERLLVDERKRAPGISCLRAVARKIVAALRQSPPLPSGGFDEALTPSGDTKAAYMGEFSFTIMQAQEDEDGEAIEVPSKVYVPWTTIKEIMAAIKARALSNMRGMGG